MKYRETLYQNYHTTQSGRAGNTSTLALFDREKKQFFNEIIPLLLTDKSLKIFDMGCGSGSLLKILQELGYTNTSGMDLSEQQVELALEMQVKNVQLGNAIDYISNVKNEFDIILGMDIIEHFSKDELVSVLQNIKNALKENGIAIFRTPNMDAPFATVFANGDFTHENYLNASSAEQVMMACGFKHVQVKNSTMKINNPIKELIRKIVYNLFLIQYKLMLFATARSTKKILFSPNLIIKVTK